MRSCPHCQATTRQIQAGKTETGLQRYQCMHCNHMYTEQSEDPGNAISIPEATSSYVPAAVAPVIARDSIQELQPALVSTKTQGTGSSVPTFPVEENRGLVSRLFDWASATNLWGRLPEIAVLESAGLLLLAWAFTERRAASSPIQPFLWLSLAALILPVALRLASAAPARRERMGLILLLGLSLYVVKVMYSPLAFTFPDELSHLRNVNEILRTHHLFQENPILPVTSLYPGLPIVTSTLTSLSGLSTFSAGVLVIGFARLILFLALFLLYEQVSGSARIAGLAVLLYIANPNFLYWLSEYAYESLALPLLTFVLLAVAKRETVSDRNQHFAWTVVAVLGLLTVVVTHHMSSYILTGLLIALVIFYAIRSRGKQWGPWDITLVALFSLSFWLVFIASFTITYLSPVLLGAIRSIFGMISDEQQSRSLFISSSGSTGSAAPLWEQLVAVGSLLFIALGLPFGVFETWRNHRNKMFALLLALLALAYLPMQFLRFTKDGWETANRSSEFLFIGIGFALALAINRFWLPQPRWIGWKGQTALATLAVILFFGGLISGWPPRARWPRPYAVSIGSQLLRPQIVSVAEWMRANLGPDHRIVASKADAKLLNAYDQYPFTDTGSSIKTMFSTEVVGPAERHTLSKRNVEYVVSDRKAVSWDIMIGYYFYNKLYSSTSDLQLVEPRVHQKFDGLQEVNRLLDTGDIVVYDVGRYLASSNEQSTNAPVKSPTHRQVSVVPSARIPESTNHLRSGTREQLSSCNAQPNDASMNLFMRLMPMLNKIRQAGCLNGRMP